MVFIKVTITVEQKNPEEKLAFKDKKAEMILEGNYRRIIYEESDDVLVSLDITEEEISLRRQGDWLTQGVFSLINKSFILIKNELGTLRFDVVVESFINKENELYVKYHLLEEDEKTSTHEYKCNWKRRKESCQENH